MYRINPPVPNLRASVWVSKPKGVLSINTDVLNRGVISFMVSRVIENVLDCVVTRRIVL